MSVSPSPSSSSSSAYAVHGVSMILIVCVILISFIITVIAQDCGQLYFNGTRYSLPEGGIIRMPELITDSSNVPHTCTFIIRNLNQNGQVKLLFDDFLMYGGNATSASCDWPYNQDHLEIFDGDDAKKLPLFESCFTKHKRPSALLSSGNTMRLEYSHWSKFPGYPAFKAHYYFIDDGYWHDKPVVETEARYENGDSQFSNVLSVDAALDMVWLIVAPAVSHIFVSLEAIQLQGVTWDPSISFQIHDGLTSDSQLVRKFSKVQSFTALSIASSKNALYMRWQSQSLTTGTVTVAGTFVFYTDIVPGLDECLGFSCISTGRCISSVYECDGIDHCGDKADEIYCHACDSDKNFYCFNGGICTPKSTGDYRCQCPRGYSGVHCEHDESSCPDFWCHNGGSCRIIPNSHSYECNCRHGFGGTQCQIDNTACPQGYCQHGGTCYATSGEKNCICHSAFSGSQCQNTNQACLASYCQNGGTCKGSHDQYYCECPHGFQGMYCETTIVDFKKEDNLASTLQYSLVVVVPSFVLLGLIWIGYRAKKGSCARGRPHRSRGSFTRDSFSVSTDNPSSISRTVSRMNSTSTASSYTDDPPPYHSVAGISPRSRNRLLSRTSISLQPCVPEEPPPSYETVITSLESCGVRIIPQTNQSGTPSHCLQETALVAESSLSQMSSTTTTMTSSEDCVYSSSCSIISNTSPSRECLPDVVYSGCVVSIASENANQCEQGQPLLSNSKD